MKLFLVLSLYFLTLVPSLYANEKGVYSTANFQEKVPDSSVIRLRAKLRKLNQLKKYDSAIYFSKKLKLKAEDLNDKKLLSKAYQYLGFHKNKLHELDSSFFYYSQALKASRQIKDSSIAASRLSSMASIQNGLGDFNGSIETAIEGLNYLKNSTKLRRICGLYHIIAISQKERGNYDEALRWNTKIFELLDKPTPVEHVASISIFLYANTRANILAKQQKFSESISILKDLRNDSLYINNPINKALINTNLGRIKWLDNPANAESEELLLSGLELRTKHKAVSGLVSSNTHLANYYKKKAPKKALGYALNALKNAEIRNNKAAILESSDIVIDLKNILGENIKAEAMLTLLAEKAQEEKANIIMWMTLLAVIALSVFIMYRKNNQKEKAELEAAYKAEIRVAKRIHDELGNDIFYMMTQIKGNPEILEKDKGLQVLDGLDKVYQKARDITKEYNPIQTDDAYGEELQALLNSYGNDKIKIITTQLEDDFWKPLNKEKKLELFWIVRELMTNMRKHSKANFVGITFTKIKNELEVNYSDNGVGFDKGLLKQGSGLGYVENRIKKLNGSINFVTEPNNGLTIKIKFPI